MNKRIIVGAVVVLVVLGAGIWFFTKNPSEPKLAKLDVIDTTVNFYDQWLKAAQESTTKPDRATLAISPILSTALSARLVSAVQDSKTTPDPVLCQTVIPAGISTRKVFEEKDKAQVLIMSKDKNVTNQAIVNLTKNNDYWYIDNIECSAGEIAPEREFSFEHEGYLIKGSVPPPYNPKNWHLVFEENGEAGHLVPLLFDATSQCVSLEGTKAVCKPDQFKETTKVSVHSQMTERGASVKRMEFVQ